MNTIVNQLLDVDKEARMILDEAQQYYDKTIDELEKEKRELTAKYEEKRLNRLESVRKAEEASTNAAALESQRRYAELTKSIEEFYAQNHERWETELFNNCVRR